MAVSIVPGPRLSEERLVEVERGLPIRLPDDYRTFLLESNGGEPEPNIVAGSEIGATVRRFYSIDDGGGSRDLEWAMRASGPFPPNVLPVAFEDGGNSFLLNEFGEVLYWDHELELDQPDPEHPGFGPATTVASSFAEFLESLLPD